MRRSLFTWLVGASLMATAMAGPAVADSPPNIVGLWNRHAANALINPPSATVPGAGQPPPVAVLHLAMVQGAVYDAVNAVVGSHQPYLDGLSAPPSTASLRAAVATAARDVLINLVPALPEVTRTWVNNEYAASMSAISASEAAADVSAGVEIGSEAAAEMLAARAADGRYPSTPFNFSQGTAAGQWRPTATAPPFTDPFAWVANVDPFVVDSASQFGSEGPLRLTSTAYAREYNEVKELGSLTGSSRTQDQTDLAMFFTVHPVEMFNRTFRGISDARGLSIADSARLLVTLNMSGADALISCWADKELWSFWRPLTAIRLGADDGNLRTDADATWTPLVPNPPYPDHPSGYNCLTSSMMHAAGDFFGTNNFEFSLQRTADPAAPVRTYDRFTDVVKDTIDARVYLGIHFRSADEQGAVMGKKVAHWLDGHYFQPRPSGG